jgi:crotonobetainyl-CoA:carnitine CoA-transferase CaiB-like acyl-CoA transferase
VDQTLTVAEVEALMIEHSIPAGMIYRAPEMLADPHFKAREALVEVDTPALGQGRRCRTASPSSPTPPAASAPPRRKASAQHNDGDLWQICWAWMQRTIENG